MTSDEKQTDGIVWSEVHQRLKAIQESAEKRFATTTSEGRNQILKVRAKALARELKQAEAAGESIQVVEFRLAHESYAIESEYIHEVYPLKELTPLPCTPSFVLGIINVRGEVLSVIDIRKFFDLPGKGLTDLNRVIIVSMDEMKFGILADTISGARLIPLTDIQPPLPMLTGIHAEYLRGVTSERLVVLDAAKILADRNIVIHEEVET